MGGFERKVSMYDVRIAACRVEPRWDIPEFTYRVGASSRRLAIMWAVEACASQNGVPPMRTQLREIAKHAVATLDVVTVKL